MNCWMVFGVRRIGGAGMGRRSDTCDERVKPRAAAEFLLAVGVSPRSPRNVSLDESRAAAAWDRRAWMSPFQGLKRNPTWATSRGLTPTARRIPPLRGCRTGSAMVCKCRESTFSHLRHDNQQLNNRTHITMTAHMNRRTFLGTTGSMLLAGGVAARPVAGCGRCGLAGTATGQGVCRLSGDRRRMAEARVRCAAGDPAEVRPAFGSGADDIGRCAICRRRLDPERRSGRRGPAAKNRRIGGPSDSGHALVVRQCGSFQGAGRERPAGCGLLAAVQRSRLDVRAATTATGSEADPVAVARPE